MTETVKVHGLDVIVKRLRALPRAVSGRNGGPLRQALAAVAKIVRDDARSRVAVDTGQLRENIIMYRDREPERIGANEHYQVGVRKLKLKPKIKRFLRRARRNEGVQIRVKEAVFYWRFLEFGTSKMAAKPFLRPAFEANKHLMSTVFTQILSRGIEAAARKVAGS